MLRSTSHIILALLLAILIIVEPGLPCVDNCEATGEETSAQVVLADCVDADHDAASHNTVPQGDHSSDGTTHCAGCTCICHVPAIQSINTSLMIPRVISIPNAWHSVRLTTLPSAPPDHIPLT
jgi:hypothetical protein